MSFFAPRRRLAAPILGLALLAAPTPSAAEQGPRISELSVTVDGNRAMVGFRLEGAFDDRLVERVQSGLPTGFVFQLELLKDRKRWYDRPLEESTFQVTAMYDSLSREFLVNYKLGGKLIESRMVDDLAELEAALTRVEGLPAFELDPYPRVWRLLVRVRAEVGRRTLLGFIPTKDTTDWRESNKFRTLNRLPGEV
jgi:hypothetical protein